MFHSHKRAEIFQFRLARFLLTCVGSATVVGDRLC
jgi:hypothetical protein